MAGAEASRTHSHSSSARRRHTKNSFCGNRVASHPGSHEVLRAASLRSSFTIYALLPGLCLLKAETSWGPHLSGARVAELNLCYYRPLADPTIPQHGRHAVKFLGSRRDQMYRFFRTGPRPESCLMPSDELRRRESAYGDNDIQPQVRRMAAVSSETGKQCTKCTRGL